jgi:hypothetical protein
VQQQTIPIPSWLRAIVAVSETEKAKSAAACRTKRLRLILRFVGMFIPSIFYLDQSIINASHHAALKGAQGN